LKAGIALTTTKSPSGSSGAYPRNPDKAQRYFEHAAAVAEARNFDYAVDCYVKGFRYQPDNLQQYDALMQAARMRKTAGGKPAGLSERLRAGGSSATDKWLHNLRLWALDPHNPRHGRDTMRWLLQVHESYPNLGLDRVMAWMANQLLELLRQKQNPDRRVLAEVVDFCKRGGALEEGVAVCKQALEALPHDDELWALLRELEQARPRQVEEAPEPSGPGETSHPGFTVEPAASAVSGQGVSDEEIARLERDDEAGPDEPVRLQELLRRLLSRNTDADDEKARQIVERAWQRAGHYQYRIWLGDLRIRQLVRRLRQLKRHINANPDDREARREYDQLRQQRIEFELQEYRERLENDPQNPHWPLALGKRLYQAGQFDEAIAQLEVVERAGQGGPRAIYLARCHLAKGDPEQAVAALVQGMADHTEEADRTALELRYHLAEALEKAARQNQDPEQLERARQYLEELRQQEAPYRDLAQRLERLDVLAEQLNQKAGAAESPSEEHASQ